jgi:Mg2+/Co2+ transporter CorB
MVGPRARTFRLDRTLLPPLGVVADMTVLDSTAASVVVLAALLAASAFFSSTEIAVFSLSPDWLDDRAAGDARAAILAELRGDPHRLLVTLLVGNNLVNVAISSLLAVLLVDYVPAGVAVVATTLVAGSVVLIAGEILPKAYGLGHAEAWSLRAARPVWLVERLLLPVVVVFDVVTRRVGAVVGADPGIEGPYADRESAATAPGEGAK